MTPRPPAPTIVTRNLEVGHPGLVTLHDANITLPGGRISVILGASGCGKSTLLRHILGLAVPNQGQILIEGEDLFGMSPKRFYEHKRSMGVLFQDGALLGSLTLAENISLPLLEHTELDEVTIRTMVRLKLSLVGLDKFMDFYPNQLSGGMRKRGGLARALIMDPRILLCDEPSSGLDPITAAEVDQLILDLHDALGMTVVVVTHDLDSLFTIAEHVVVLHGGMVLFEGGIEELKTTEDIYIRQFLDRQPNIRQAPVCLLREGTDT
ncbi:ATP-binding cassette domain-containing protein [Desulfovibrio mangrovi]|uniref:ABC transporter ATP-binding protein n=1 Tax=Desulfovibrio mangrovi TaxID=2976983 RepID=UPI0022451F55|nr:ATP-binding cassette domain-containing protein [Desulfovibrio mangrovi]UZP66553.1 ATP-binding cassette domain-containing protein [Desulfovibrio mangrovi]